jgi:hypothetical protein
VKVSMDGEILQSTLDGTAIQVDPGTHTFHFEPTDGVPGDQQVLVLEGEKARVITYAISGAVAAPPGQPPPGQPSPEQPSSWNGTKTAAVAVAGVGVVSLAVGIIVGAMGSSQASSDKSAGGCAPPGGPAGCSDDEVSSIKTKLIVSDILIPVGIVGVGAGIVLYLTSGGSSKASASTGLNLTHGVRLDASPVKNGATFGLHGSF